MSPQGLRDISGEQWLFGAFSAADSSYSAIQEMVNARRGSESGNNQLNSFLQGGEVDEVDAASYLMLPHTFILCLQAADTFHFVCVFRNKCQNVLLWLCFFLRLHFIL